MTLEERLAKLEAAAKAYVEATEEFFGIDHVHTSTVTSDTITTVQTAKEHAETGTDPKVESGQASEESESGETASTDEPATGEATDAPAAGEPVTAASDVPQPAATQAAGPSAAP